MSIERELMKAKMHMTNVRHLADTNQIVWSRFPTPHPTAMQSFQGVAKGYRILMVKATTAEYGNVIEAMITTDGGQIIHVDRRDPDGLAAHLFTKAEAAAV